MNKNNRLIKLVLMNRILIIDNYDSFTWNLYQYFREMGGLVEVKRHDSIDLLDFNRISCERLVISPGPGNPSNSGYSLEVIHHFYKKIPILGVCLGHQIIARFFGAQLKKATIAMHGKSSMIRHNGFGVFTGLSRLVNVVRYHSLIVDSNTIPVCLEITAWSISGFQNSEIMGLRHKHLFVEGIQFHPESVLTEQGHQMLFNFMTY